MNRHEVFQMISGCIRRLLVPQGDDSLDNGGLI